MISSLHPVSTYLPQITSERLFALVATVSAVALAALQIYGTFSIGILGIIGLNLLNAILFTESAHRLDSQHHGMMKNWMITSNLITSIALSLSIATTVVSSVSSLQSVIWTLKSLAHPYTISILVELTGAVGFGMPIATSLYRRGLELFKLEEWTQMREYMSLSRQSRFSIRLLEAPILYLAIVFPNLFTQHEWPRSFKKFQFIALTFLSAEERVRRFNDILTIQENVAGIDEAIAEIKPLILEIFQSFPTELQVKHLPKLIRIFGNNIIASAEISEIVREAFRKKAQELQSCHATLLAGWKTRLDHILSSLRQDNNQLQRVAGELTTLRGACNTYLNDCRSYCPELPLQAYTQLAKELIDGECARFVQELTNRQQIADTSIDLEDPAWNYFIMHYTHVRGSNETLLSVFSQKLGMQIADYNQLDSEMEKLHIETIGKFITHVLGGDPEILKNQEAVFNRLDEFLADRKELRYRTYIQLAGHFTSNAVNKVRALASSLLYRMAMTLTTVATVIHLPITFFIGLCSSALYHRVAIVKRVFDRVIPFFVSCGTVFGFYFTDALRMFSRRPFFRPILGGTTQEMTLFQSADFSGQMRILFFEFLSGLSFMNASLFFGEIPVGGLIMGVSAERDLSSRI